MALSGAPGIAGFHHLMLEVEQFTDVGRALDIVNDKKLTLAMSLGRHTNDMMTSFYVRTPSGFEIEYGPDRASAIGVVPLSSLKDLDIEKYCGR